jgi:hypothetical protein
MTRARAKLPFRRNVVPDKLDLRDRVYQPSIEARPPARLNSLTERGAKITLPVLDQGRTEACTGFSLSNVINFLLQEAGRKREAPVSPFMLYSMARRYDEFRGNDPGTGPESKTDTGSSLRGGMKGWYKHGACAASLWRGLQMPPPHKDLAQDWWPDAARRPLGAYYRVDHRSVSDMHVALTEVGILYASAVCHAGWDQGNGLSKAARKGWRIPPQKALDSDGGHAFAIVGYDATGFLVLNSWGPGWGDGGLATLSYEDWLDNAMDCWVAQLGVVTAQHTEIAGASSLRMRGQKRVVVAGDPVLRNREIGPFIVDMGKDGRLSDSGDFRTNADDLASLVGAQMKTARERWKLGGKPLDVAVYAHGGLTSEGDAAKTAAQWIPALYEQQIFPIFFMWETDMWSTIKNQLTDFTSGEPRPTGGVGEWFRARWDERLEHSLAAPGGLIWDQMKKNARAIADNPQSGANQLFALARKVEGFNPEQVRLHLIGHSAGSIVHSFGAKRLCDAGWKLGTVAFMAPAVRLDVFQQTLLPAIKAGQVQRYVQFHLDDAVEQKDPTCRPFLGYGRSLLYLVSQSFEGGRRTPILGMQTFFDDPASKLSKDERIRAFVAPSDCSASTTHGGFDDDPKTRASVINCIKGRLPA